ncbi:MAG: hypothetical protein M1837_000513 [Sclerophora amabilis]|nr:MAG: hypothetical protein M1837_000513 [Sclerophora amabilis]
MLSSQAASVAIGGAGLLLVTATSIPPLRALSALVTSHRKHNGYAAVRQPYEDSDGIATEESSAAFSDRIPKACIYLASCVGFSVSIASAGWGTLHAERALLIEGWLQVGVWTFLLLHAISLYLEPSSTRRYDLGLYGALACLILDITLCGENGTLAWRNVAPRPYTVHLSLNATQFVLATSLLFAHLSLPRRPDVYYEGHVVEAQYTVSALERIALAWCYPLLKFASAKRTLDLQNLPKLDYLRRSRSLVQSFSEVTGNGRLWRRVVRAHASDFARQWAFCIFGSVMDFAPQLAMYKILRLLELRQEGASLTLEAWLWVLALGLGRFLQAFTDTWMWWIGWGAIGVPVRSQLSNLTFAKAMRRKDIKGIEETAINPDLDDSTQAKGKSDAASESEDSASDENTGQQKSRQSQVNLIAVDATRVSEFTVINIFYPSTVVALAVSVTFLVNLIGWASLLAGLLVTVITTPLNTYFAKKYTSSQDRLMKVRDVKMGVVTEALQGIRQIKFSALETQWQKKIGEVRTREIKELWSVFICDTMLIFTWIACPVLLAAVSLAVYTILNKELTPSVAFTAISVFGELEITLSIIPELTTMLLDAWVSLERIEKYLESPEKVPSTTPADSVSFEHAYVAWPSDQEASSSEQFTLRDINVEFPNEELSVISGKTGSGKSLLIASVMGEADIISGVIKAPKPPAMHDRHDDKATRSNWIVPSSIAFVAQIPWIENATFKDNILFGLPFDDQRYRKVIYACALEQDLQMLSDADETEIGANGINLSGGQRWRVSFARALYSRAGILILDDIFSAVDTHVGRHLLEKALIGELGRGRTRLLVTHHVGLCLPHAQYSVCLENGAVEHAGLLDDLKRTGSLTEILKKEPSTTEDVDALHLSDDDVDGKTNDNEMSAKTIEKPRTFVEEEARERGKIKWDVYKEYLVSSGGVWFCGVSVVAFASAELLVLGRLVGIFIAGTFVSPWMLLFALVILGVCLFYARRYLVGAREIKRLQSNTKSPILEVFSAALTGLQTIRAFDKAEDFIGSMFSKIDDHTTTEWHLWLVNRWFGLRMGVLGAVFAMLVAAIVITAKGMEPSLAGFALGFALQYTETVIWVMRRYANMELNMNATERVVEYSRVPIEDQGGADVPAMWPAHGQLAVNDLVVGYAEDLPPVLKGLSFKVERNQRVGVVGRTGAGKSSLTLALYRFLEAREGSIHIDDIDISKIKLQDLRSRLAIIPQDPVLFSGTVRSNLDPFDQYDDADLLDALQRVQLIRTESRDELDTPPGPNEGNNINVFESLSSLISESGLNLSQGQRQLLCLARAIVSRPKIMILDEATSAVDMSTDVLIQRSIREEFTDTTLLVIAHRLSTIVDFDKILVMSQGKVAEYDSPKRLMEKEGEFWRMVNESGEKGTLEDVILGGGGGDSSGSSSSAQAAGDDEARK